MATTELYRIGEREAQPKRHRKLRWLITIIIILLLLFWGFTVARNHLKPKTVIKQAKATITQVTDPSAKTKQYDEPDFTVDLPASWSMLPRPPNTFQSFSWSNDSTDGNEEEFEIFEDTIPANFAVNQVQIVSGETDHLELEGALSDNCVNFTRDEAVTNGEYGVLAKWQGVDFICDRSNQERDLIGTSSSDGLNIVKLTDTSTATVHQFLFTFTNNSITPDPTTFNTILTSLKMK
jgi:hypothetical protein